MRAPLIVVRDEAQEQLSPLERLEQEELRLLAIAVGDHLPAELAERVAAIRHERAFYKLASEAA